MAAHHDAVSAERDPLGLEAEALLEGIDAVQQDAAACADDAVPWQRAFGGAQRPGYLAGRAGEPGSPRDLAIGGDASPRDLPYHGAQGFQHGGLLAMIGGVCQGPQASPNRVNKVNKSFY